jgi:outer membrane protein assembly factor BamB
MRRGLGPLVAALACLLGPAGAGATVAAWTTYRHDAARSGVDPDSGSPVPPALAWETPAGTLDGQIFAQPLVYGSRVYVATENDTIYSLDAATGAVIWSKHVATAVPGSQLDCGDIDPVGITGTPVIDPATNAIYAVTDTWDGSSKSSINHQLFAVNLTSGNVLSGFPIPADPPFPSGGGGDAAHQLQRTALTLFGVRIVIGYGGNDGDCGTYWGWMVGAPESGAGGLTAFQADAGSGDHGGAIWGAGTGPALDGSGNLYAATGNGYSSSFDYSESVLRLDAGLHLLSFWAPQNWSALDGGDADIGSSEPALLPGNLLFQSGKDGQGYLLNAGALGGVSAPVDSVGFCQGGSFGGAVYAVATATIYAACMGGLQAISLTTSGSAPSLGVKQGFSAPSDAVGPPVLAGGLVWVTAWTSGRLLGLDPGTGAASFQYPLPGVNHFATPSAGGGRLFVGDGDRVLALTIANPPPSTPPGGGGGGGSPAAPRLSHVRLAPARFAATRATTLKLTLSERAAVTVAITNRVRGRIVGGRCKRAASGRPRCTLIVRDATRMLTGKAGGNSFKLHLRGLRPGSYTMTVTATAGAKRSAPARLAIRVTGSA